MQIKETVKQSIVSALSQLDVDVENIELEHPNDLSHGDYSSNVAMKLSKQLSDSPRDIAEKIVSYLPENEIVDRVEIAGPGFINFYLNKTVLFKDISQLPENFGENNSLHGKKIVVEYAHPNTHKEMHIGHMRTLIVGEALARIFDASGAEVFRANYQGDIGPHVAKAMWGTQKILEERSLLLEEVEEFTPAEKAHLLGKGYVLANQKYDENKEQIDQLNKQLYAQDTAVMEFYKTTRRWSLDYYDSLYERFDTKFDAFYFESDVANDGVKVVQEQVGNVFDESDGAIIFDGEKYGMHKRVFITGEGYPTYEAKDMGLAPRQYEDFSFDTIIHVVGDEQSGYFQVVIRALEELYPYLQGKEYHLPMGMVNLKGLKMSSRTGVLITVDGLLEEVKDRVSDVMKQEDDNIREVVTLGAVKYSVLKNDPTAYTLFDLEESINLNGNSGPYLQYTHARCVSVLDKADTEITPISTVDLNDDEDILLRTLYQFPEVIEVAARQYAPNLICNYLFEVAQKFNSFYQTSTILHAEQEKDVNQRLVLTKATAQILKTGLNLLGIQAPNRM